MIFTVIEADWSVVMSTESQEEIDKYIVDNMPDIYQVLYQESETHPYHVYWDKNM